MRLANKNNIILSLIIIGVVLLAGCISQQSNVVKLQSCENLQTTERDDCYFKEALYRTDSNLCKNIVIENGTDNCYLQLAMKTGDTSFCNDISSKYMIQVTGAGEGKSLQEILKEETKVAIDWCKEIIQSGKYNDYY